MELEGTVSAGSETISPPARSEFNKERSYHPAFLVGASIICDTHKRFASMFTALVD